MVFLSGNYPKRSPMQRLMRRLFGVIAIALIIFLLSEIPYDILREERFRLFGEMRTTGIVLAVHSDGAAAPGKTYSIDYKYIDQDGYAHETSAPLARNVWETYHPGSRLEVIYVRSRPDLTRVKGEVEPAFQVWLRNVLE